MALLMADSLRWIPFVRRNTARCAGAIGALIARARGEVRSWLGEVTP